MTEDNKMAVIKLSVHRRWKFSLSDVAYAIEETEFDLECLLYERDVTQRLYDAATDEKERQHWQKQIDRIDKAMANTEARLAKQRRRATYREAMLAIIQADLEAEGIDPDTCDLDDLLFPDDDFDDDFSDSDVPF